MITGSIAGPAMTLDGKIGNVGLSVGGPAETTRVTETVADPFDALVAATVIRPE